MNGSITVDWGGGSSPEERENDDQINVQMLSGPTYEMENASRKQNKICLRSVQYFFILAGMTDHYRDYTLKHSFIIV